MIILGKMKLAEIILENERKQQTEKNTQLVSARLKELVYAFPNEVLRVLHKTGLQVSSLAPSAVLYAVVINNVESNPELKDAIAKMILELDGYAQADGEGQGWSLAGNIVSAVGTVLTGIGRSQAPVNGSSISAEEKQNLIDQAEAEKAKGQRRTWIAIGISVVVIVAIIIGFKIYQGNKSKLSQAKLAKL